MKQGAWILYYFVLAASLHTMAQSSSRESYDEAVAAYTRGDCTTVIGILEPRVRSGSWKGADLGRASALLGSCYRAKAEYGPAERTYEKALQLLKDDAQSTRDYEIVLRESGAFYREMGDPVSAERLENQGLQLSEKNQDHAAIARACQGLAELLLNRNEFRKGESFVARAAVEAHLTDEFDEDDRAYLAQLQGWVARKRGDTQSAINDYLQAIDLLTRRYGDSFALTGWGHVLLADAYDQQGSKDEALDEMRKGTTILEHVAGTHDPRYAAAEIRYAKLLEKTGQHSLAAQMKRQGEATLHDIQQTACAGCTMGVAALR